MNIDQKVAVFIDGNNIERNLPTRRSMINFDTLIPRLVGERTLVKLMYFREGRNISDKLSWRLRENFYGITVPCYKNAGIKLALSAMKLIDKIDTAIILSGDSDYIELIRSLREGGVMTEVCGVRGSISHVLRKEAEYYSFIREDEIWEYNPQNFNRDNEDYDSYQEEDDYEKEYEPNYDEEQPDYEPQH